MEHWCGTNTLAYHPTDGKAYQALADKSGNLQSYALDSEEEIENQDPRHQRHLGRPPLKPETQHPAPGLTLASNDDQLARHLRLQLHRHRRERKSNPARPYLNDPRYIKYRTRPRCDRGSDGKPLWGEPLEDAFQNGKWMLDESAVR